MELISIKTCRIHNEYCAENGIAINIYYFLIVRPDQDMQVNTIKYKWISQF